MTVQTYARRPGSFCGDLGTMPKDIWIDRMTLDWNLSKMLPLAINFAVIIFVFLLNLNMERPVFAMYEIKNNLRYHFHLEDIYEVHTFEAMYSFLYKFLESAERFDPLAVDTYVAQQLHPAGVFNSEMTRKVYLEKLHRFTAVSAMIVKPQIWMTRLNARPCDGFATKYDKLYSMSKYLRHKYAGTRISGGWQPREIEFRDGPNSPYQRVSERIPDDIPPPARINIEGHAGSSYFLTCVDDGVLNETMPEYLANRFSNVEYIDAGTVYFGDYSADKTDILAYMGYNVYESNINLTTHPRCFMEHRRDPETNEIQSYLNEEGLLVFNGTKVTLQDVDVRCEKTAQTWHDVQTSDIHAKILLYTPSYEIFTKVYVDWKVELSGALTPSYDVLSFQDLKTSSRYRLWLALTILQLFLGILQFAFMIRRTYLEVQEEKMYPRIASFENGEKASILYGALLQSGYMAFYCYRLSQETGNLASLWDLIEGLVRVNPYASEQATQAAMKAEEALNHYPDGFQRMRLLGFVLVFGSFLQIISYMGVHPQLGLIANTLRKVGSSMVNWLCIFFAVFFVLVFLGTWAFGEAIGVFSWGQPAFIMAFNMALGNFQFMEHMEDLQMHSDIVLLAIWEVAVLAVAFLVLLNFFLAIVVDGYTEVKSTIAHSSSIGFVSDVTFFVWSRYHYLKNTWPRCAAIIDKFQDIERDQVSVPDLLATGLFGQGDSGRVSAEKFFKMYLRILEHRTHVLEAEPEEKAVQDKAVEPVEEPGTRAISVSGELLQLLMERTQQLEKQKADKMHQQGGDTGASEQQAKHNIRIMGGLRAEDGTQGSGSDLPASSSNDCPPERFLEHFPCLAERGRAGSVGSTGATADRFAASPARFTKQGKNKMGGLKEERTI